MHSIEVTPEVLNELLEYNCDDGSLIWRHRDMSWFSGRYKERSKLAWNSKWAGAKALNCINKYGYLKGAILGRNFLAHRVAWAMYYGDWPKLHIDHINGDKTCNKISNLRDVDASSNMKNMKMSTRNTSGLVGVSWHSRCSRWQVFISVDGVSKTVGYFDDIDDAAAARKSAEIEFGYHENHGRHE